MMRVLLFCLLLCGWGVAAAHHEAPNPYLQLAEATDLFAGEDDLFAESDDLFAEEPANDPVGASDDLFGAPDALEEPAPEPTPAETAGAGEEVDLFADLDTSEGIVEVPPEKSRWITIGGPLGLFIFYFAFIGLNVLTVPFKVSREDIQLYHFPTGVKRGLAFAVTLYGIAFVLGASEIVYQLELHGTAAAYFEQMSLGKLIAFTHAHLFGFTTCFLIVGIPFSMQFNHIRAYQMVFPAGLAAAFVDVASWWGIKYLTPNFEYVSVFCGIVFSVTYFIMLVGLLRVILFPHVIWRTDKDADERREKLRVARKERIEDEFGPL